MTKNHLKLLDVDEHMREKSEEVWHKDAIAVCCKHGLTLDLATSNVIMYVLGTDKRKVVEDVARCYYKARKLGTTRVKRERKKEWAIY